MHWKKIGWLSVAKISHMGHKNFSKVKSDKQNNWSPLSSFWQVSTMRYRKDSSSVGKGMLMEEDEPFSAVASGKMLLLLSIYEATLA